MRSYWSLVISHWSILASLAAGLIGGVAAEPAFPGTAGFGADSRGGKGGAVIMVTRLDDDVRKPLPGMFRWAVRQKGPRIIKFQVAGTILLKDTVSIREPFLTIDGQDAPGLGVCLRGGSLELEDTHDIIIRYLRVRLGDENTLRRNKSAKLKRPKGSAGLDCIEMRRSQNILLDHVSVSWSCDELFSVVHCRNVTVQWCLMAEPLSNPALHPYGDNHAFCFNASASTLSIHHCLFARYVMRGPQFEANDMRKADRYAVRMEAVNNVMFDYQHSGSRYTTGVEDHKAEASKQGYDFQFLSNVYLGKPKRPQIEAVLKHGIQPNVRVYADDARLIALPDNDSVTKHLPGAKLQIQRTPLFSTSATVLRAPADDVQKAVLEHVGCSHARDTADQRILDDVRQQRFRAVLKSQKEVGGWPDLSR